MVFFFEAVLQGAQGLFSVFKPGAQLMQLLERGGVFFPGGIVVDGKQARVVACLQQRPGHSGRRRDMHMVGQAKVAQNDGAAANGAVRANGRAARHAGAAGHGAVFPDAHVVANLYQIVELDTVFEHRVLQGAAVDAGIGANFDIIANLHRAELLDLHPPTTIWGKAKAVCTNHRAGVNDAALTNAATVGDRHTRRKQTACAYGRICTNDAVGADLRAIANRRTGSNAGKGAYRHAQANAGGRVNHGARMDGWHGLQRMQPFPELRDQCEIMIRIVHHDTRAALHCRIAG